MNWHIYDTKVDSGNDLMARKTIKSLKQGNTQAQLIKFRTKYLLKQS